jgi:multiple sugar transport system substrate-binding protein
MIMSRKLNDTIEAFRRGRMGRREFFARGAAFGVGTGTLCYLLNRSVSRALAQEFDWKAHDGTAIKLLLNKHPYTDAMIANLDNFKEMSGMEVSYDVFPEDVYFDKVTAALSSGSTEYDAFMTGAYQTWQYGPAGWLVDLNEFIQDPALTNPNYDWEDVLPNLRASTSWSGVPGEALGGEGAKQWCIPWGFELNSVAYNRRVFEELGLTPPANLPEMLEVAARITKEADGM